MSNLKTIINRSSQRLKDSSLPAPVGGLNGAISYDEMPLNEAIVMDNYIPKSSSVSLRKGYKKHAYNLPFTPRTLVPYISQTGHDRLFAFGDGNVLEISEKRAYDSFGIQYLNKSKNLEAGKFSHGTLNFQQFKDRIYLLNGIDEPKVYLPDETGETFGTIEAFPFEAENLMQSTLKNVFVSKQRLWFIEKNTMRVWYSENAGEVQGKLLCFDMGAVASFAGHLVAGASWTQDGGAGMDDLTCFITSAGEVLVYKGNDPNNASDWSLKGVYKMAAPIGDRCFLKYHGDLILISKEGFIPLSKALPLEGANASLLAFSSKVNPIIEERASFFASKSGWQALLYPAGGYALFNVPISRGYEQYICNTSTGAWARFKSIKAHDFCLFNDRLYFAGDNAVYLFDEGYTDDGLPIYGRIEQAFTNFLSSRLKRVTLLNPHLKTAHPIQLNIYMNTDFDMVQKPYETVVGDEGDSPWNALKWSTLKPVTGAQGSSFAKWATLSGVKRSGWVATLATGTYFSLVIATSTKGTGVDFYSTMVRYE